jgi:hypothetical protein
MIGYIGVIPLIFVISGFIHPKLLGIRFWIIILFSTLMFILPNPISYLPYQLHIPILSVLQPTRMMVIVDFCLVMTAVYGLNGFMTGIKPGKLIIIAGSILGLLWVYICGERFTSADVDRVANYTISLRNIIMPTIYLFVAFILIISDKIIGKRSNPKPGIILMLLMITIIDLFRFGWKFTPFTDSAYFFPGSKVINYLSSQPKPFRVIVLDDRILPPDTAVYFGLETVSGYDPVYTARYGEFIAAMERGKPDINRPLGFDRIITPKNIQSPLFRILNVRYILSINDLDSSRYRLIMSEGETKLYENQDFIPRFFYAENAIYRDSINEIIGIMYGSSFNPGRDIVLEKNIRLPDITPDVTEKPVITRYTDNEIKIDSDTKTSRILFLGLVYNSGWSIKIDGYPAEIFRADLIFSAVAVPGGRHELQLEYGRGI